MASLHSIFQDIALIISANSDAYILRDRIRNNTFDWEKIVPVASKHLIIPLIYYKLKDKNVLHLLPEDLRSYLAEIARQNTERNKTILEEVKDLSLLLNTENIDHVFLKGAAMLAASIYTHIGERMIGDIDILVRSDQLAMAQELLIRNNYNPMETTFGQNFIEHKHLARLIPDKKLAAVEIHRKLLHKPVKNLLNSALTLHSKQTNNNVAVPDLKNLLIHTILNFEINDYGYYYNYLGLRNAYDAILVLDQLIFVDIYNLYKHKYIASFFSKVSIYLKVNNLSQKPGFTGLRNRFFLLKQKRPFIANLSFRFNSVVQFLDIIIRRLFLFLINKNYRKAALTDRKRIMQLLKKSI